MKRRQLLGGLLALPALPLISGLLPKPHPSLDKPWPLDIRQGFENTDWNWRVFLGDELQGGVLSVSPETGHLLAYQQTEPQELWPGLPKCSLVIKHGPCLCAPGMCLRQESRKLGPDGKVYENNDYCILMEIRRGHVRVERIKGA